MKNIKVLDLKEDKKINAKCLFVNIVVGELIELINLKGLERKSPSNKQLMKDLEEGAITAPISLILKENSNVYRKIIGKNDIKEIERIINENIEAEDFSILDGLQRTHCMLDVIEKRMDFLNTRIRAEIWYGMTCNGALYKRLVLNTGQVKSMKYQIEILSMLLRGKMMKIASMNGKELTFSNSIVEAFTSFIVKDPIVDRTNVAVKELEKMKFIEEYSSQEKLSKEDNIEEFVDIWINFNEVLEKKYKSSAVLSGIFAAFGEAFESQSYIQRKTKLFNILRSQEKDPLKLEIMSKIVEDKKKKTIKSDDSIRKLFFSVFREFLIKEEDDFETIWKRAVK